MEYGEANSDQKIGKEIVMENNENFVTEEVTENMEQTTEETVVTEPTYTQADVDRMVKEKLDEVMPGKIARREAKIRKENDRKYGALVDLLRAGTGGTGKESVEELTDTLRNFYQNKGVQMPKEPDYTENDISVLANADAQDVISGGYEEVVEEVDRLAAIGFDNMTPREKAVFKTLADHRQSTERSNELSAIGVTEDVYNSKEFQEFAGMFNPTVPITQIYKMYAKSTNANVEPIGSMKNGSHDEGKTFYTPEEVDKLTPKDLENPVVFRNVRNSMLSWPK